MKKNGQMQTCFQLIVLVKNQKQTNHTPISLRSVLFGAREHFHENSRKRKISPPAGAHSRRSSLRWNLQERLKNTNER